MARKILLQGSAIRAAYGTLALLFPQLLTASIGMSEEQVGAEARYFNRLFGGRDLLIAALTVLAVRQGEERPATAVNLLCEATDTVALLEELRRRGGWDRVLAVGLAFNVTGYATWARALLAR